MRRLSGKFAVKNGSLSHVRITLIILWLAAGGTFARQLAAQGPEIQQRIAEVKEAAARNKQALAQYTWVEQDTIILKGEQKKQEQFQVRLGADGKPEKTPLGETAAPTGHEGRLKKHIVEKKKEEYKDYADRIRELIRQYIPPDKDALEQARVKGNIMVGEEPNSPGHYRAAISNYIKQDDKMTLVMDAAQKNIVRLSIETYLDDPKDAVKVDAELSQIPGGPNHVSSATINGVSKQLTITVQNSNFQKL
jgi:hypothetical protein